MDKSRRKLLKGAVAAGGGAAFVAGYSGPLEKMAAGLGGSAGEKPKHPIYGNALEPEYAVDAKTGVLTLNPNQRTAFTICYGCTTKCGVRVRIDNTTDNVLRVIGNPYHPLSSEPHLPMHTPVADALKSVSAHQDTGLAGRSTACARGNAMMAQITSPHRVTHCLKRVGERGSHRWTRISFEQLVEEVCEGGDLFGEGNVDGLRAIHDHDTPVDANNPEYGPRANQLLVMEATDYGRSALLKRFAFDAFGTRNYGHHGSYCGLAFRMGSGALMDDLQENAHVKPDHVNTRFALFIGTAPSQAGNPFKRQGRLLAEARSLGTLDYIVVDPALNATASHAAGERSRWVPILPGTDSAFAMALIRYLLENDAIAADYLAIPSDAAATAAGEAGHTNATHLVIETPDHPRRGHFLRRSDLGETTADSDDDDLLVIDADGALAPAAGVSRATLYVEREIGTPAGTVHVKSSLTKLREAAMEDTLEGYAAHCGIPAALIERIAARFASFGRAAVADCHGGMMSANGFYAAYGIQMLNLLAGSFNRHGGAAVGGGKFNGNGEGPRYDLAGFPGKRTPAGVFLSRSRFAYEKTSEYQRKRAAGENPYPARAPWRTLAPPLLTEQLASGLDGYPYAIKAVIGCMANPFYGQAGLESMIIDKFKDPKRLGLYVAVDGFINETNRYADYIVPDSVMYEVWGFTGSWGGTIGKMTTACWPVVEPRQQKTADGEPVSMESFFIAAAKRLGLPGFDDDAIAGADGNTYPLHRAEDFYLRAAANIAYLDTPLPPADESDIRHGGIAPLMAKIERTLRAAEQGPVAYLYARGGRFEDHADGYAANGKLKHTWNKALCVYNPQVGTSIDSQSGEALRGTPALSLPRLSDGRLLREVFGADEWPLLAFSYKSNVMNSYAIGLERLRMIKPINPVLLHSDDAAARGIAHGDTVRISSPGGSVTAIALVSDGVMKGALGIEHSYGHSELGGSAHRIDDETMAANEWIRAGVSLNDLGFADPTRKVSGTWLEAVSGASIRQGLPVEVTRADG